MCHRLHWLATMLSAQLSPCPTASPAKGLSSALCESAGGWDHLTTPSHIYPERFLYLTTSQFLLLNVILVLLTKCTSSPLRSLVMFGKTVPGPFFKATPSVMIIKPFPGANSVIGGSCGTDSSIAGISTGVILGCGTGVGAGGCRGCVGTGTGRAGCVWVSERDATLGATG